MSIKKINIIVCLLMVVYSCSKPQDESLDGLFAGGAGTIFDEASNAYKFPTNNLTEEQKSQHIASDATFEQAFITGQGKTFSGLGPLYNNVSCNACHLRNGRAEPTFQANKTSGLLLRLSVPGQLADGGPVPIPFFGGQLQNIADINVSKEADFTITYFPIQEIFPDKEVVTLQKPIYTILNSYSVFPSHGLVSPRIASIIPGLGLLEAISESTILEYADENDRNKDGISGRPNYVYSVKEKKKVIGKFGWKAGMPNLEEQSAGALNQDMGITNPIFPEENCINQSNCIPASSTTDIDQKLLDEFTFYCQTVAVPAPRKITDSSFVKGKAIFMKLKCNLCHRPSVVTGSHPIKALSNQVIYPYTDLLLHDMGPNLADNRPDYKATGSEWRTPPLWGIGLNKLVNNHSRLMHDGRANGFEEAILWHGGEGENAKKQYKLLTKEERRALIFFLEHL